MVADNCLMVVPSGECFSHAEATRITKRISAEDGPKVVYLNLDRITETSTAALAQLILLRRQLLRCAGDLRLVGLHGPPKCLYEVNRLNKVLPCDH